MSQTSWVYFHLVDNARIKIGKAANLSSRTRQHERGTLDIHELTLLAAVHGGREQEKHVERYFADDAVDGFKPRNGDAPELFEPSPRLTNYIRWLRNQWFTIVEVDDDIEEPVSFDMWAPTEDRQTPPPSDPLFPPDWLEFTQRIITGDDYYTNPLVLEAARKTMGAIDLDPASHVLANRHVKADRFFSIQENGLEQKWGGRVWLNPPFSTMGLWIPKILSEWKSGRVQAICVFSAMRKVTNHNFFPLVTSAHRLCIIRGRLPNGGKGTPAPDDGHCVFYLGDKPERFLGAFSTLGKVWRPDK